MNNKMNENNVMKNGENEIMKMRKMKYENDKW